MPLTAIFELVGTAESDDVIIKLVRVLKVVLESNDGYAFLREKFHAPFLMAGLNHWDYRLMI